ncbi:MAG: DEAD/DEAH box helicase [Gaiellaceae bacterium]
MSGPAARPSSSADRLAEPLRRWVWRKGWRALRDIQERAVDPILAGRDVVVASATASGKTEAAFLPLLSRPVTGAGLRILYVSPLKALINDQTTRLESLAEVVDLTVTPWHGDVAASRKRRLRDAPSGILLITPESLEAMFVTRGSAVAAFFDGLDYVVIDELHSFIASERGRQLQSLLHRVELAVGHSVPRVGLSATLGDLDVAAAFLRPLADRVPEIVESTVTRREIRLQVRGYARDEPANPEDDEAEPLDIVDHLYGIARGGTHIVFANRRTDVEQYVHLLKRRAEQDGAPDEFWPHHGSLAKDVREDAEAALRSERPSTVVATTTLELGIDVGSVDTIAQMGPPPSVSSMRQRLGRSGRRAEDHSELRIYVEEAAVSASTPPQEQLREAVVQSVAMVQLLIERFNESPRPSALHLSTLVQQTLSLAAQRGGFRADDAWRALCATGPFAAVTSRAFATLLRDLASQDLLTQAHDGTVLLGLEGERLVNNYDFYSAFVTSDEYRLVVGPRTLGTLPVTRPLAVGDLLLFAGRRWRVLAVRDAERVIELEPAPGGRAPNFSGGAALVADAVRGRMQRVYELTDDPPYLDGGARRLLAEARETFRRLGLHDTALIPWGRDVVLFPWVGDRALDTLALMLRREGLAEAARDGLALLLPKTTPEKTEAALDRVLCNPPTAIELAGDVRNKLVEKHHWALSESLLEADFASSRLDIDAASGAAGAVRADRQAPIGTLSAARAARQSATSA